MPQTVQTIRFIFSNLYVIYQHPSLDMNFSMLRISQTPSGIWWRSKIRKRIVMSSWWKKNTLYLIIELVDKLYNSFTFCFCASPWIFFQINNFSKLPVDRTTDTWITKPVLYHYTMGDPPKDISKTFVSTCEIANA